MNYYIFDIKDEIGSDQYIYDLESENLAFTKAIELSKSLNKTIIIVEPQNHDILGEVTHFITTNKEYLLSDFININDLNIEVIHNYASRFARRWNVYMDDNIEMRADVHLNKQNIVIIEFYGTDSTDPWELVVKTNADKFAATVPGEYTIDDNSIIIAKDNVKCLWTTTMARIDADSTICQRMTEVNDDDKE